MYSYCVNPHDIIQVIEEKKASISCDIFSYGVVLWELLTHLKPFDGFGHFQVATKIVNGEVSLAWHVQVHNSIHHNLMFCPVHLFLLVKRYTISSSLA